ncbi:MAG TPA: hypothetical protein VKV02_07550 [Acidobacteriaceae bacterium]|nr:hypothetical protein [Acidobacteriaceae bacterium]
MKAPLCIHCGPEDLEQGLFGQTFYYILQLLPYLHARGIFPQWELRTRHYGDPPDYLTVPGVLDLAYTPPTGPYHRVSLWEMRRRHAHVIGNDWTALHQLWTQYFRVPARVLHSAAEVLPSGAVLGVHYRGTDKQTASWDSNPISPQEYLSLIQEFLSARPGFNVIFAATDEFAFVEELRRSVSLPVISLGEVEFHMAEVHSMTRAEKADRAMLDCVLLSQCACVIETSSALPSFAKLLNPDLEIYRCAASKLFGKLYTKMPYFPVAHIPVLPVREPASEAILARTLHLDWRTQPDGQPFLKSFVATPRWKFNHTFFKSAESLGVDRMASYVMRGFF